MSFASDNTFHARTLEVKSGQIGNRIPLEEEKKSVTNLVADTFRDVTRTRLLVSPWRVFVRIYKLQGWKGALKVFPIVWMIIYSVRGFSKYHAQEFERMAADAAAGREFEEKALTEEQNDEFRALGRKLCRQLH